MSTRRTLTLSSAVALCSAVVLGLPAIPATAASEPTEHVLVVLAADAPALAAGRTADPRSLRPSTVTTGRALSAVARFGLAARLAPDSATLDVSGRADDIRSRFGHANAVGALRNPFGSSVLAVLDPASRTKVFHRHTAYPAGAIAGYYGETQTTTAVPTPDVASRPIVATIQLSTWNPAALTTYASKNHVYASAGFDPVASGLYADRPVTDRSGSGRSCTSSDDSGQEETVLDQEAILGVAPTLRQRSYTAANNGACIYSAYRSVLDDVQAGQPIVALSTSWGACEDALSDDGFDRSYLDAVDSVLQQLVAAGVTITAATGDYGRFDCFNDDGTVDTSRYGSDYPASSPSVLAIGATTLKPGTTPRDIAWNTSDGGTGGGHSGIDLSGSDFTGWARPSWQTGTGTSGTVRELPDVSIDGDPATGLSAWFVGDLCESEYGDASPCNEPYGGTSLSAPLWAASLGQLAAQHATGAAVVGKGLIQPLLYSHASAFTDVKPTAFDTSASSIAFPVTNGYDESTGLGVPTFSALEPLLFAKAPTLSVPASSATRTVPITVTAPAGLTITQWFASSTNATCSGTGSATAPTSVQVPDGHQTITVRGLTSDGRCTDAAVGAVLVDATPPTVSITSVTNGTKVSQDAPLTVTATASDAVSGVASLSFTFAGQTFAAVAKGAGAFSATLPAGVRPVASYPLGAVASDTFGNLGSTSVTVSLLAPKGYLGASTHSVAAAKAPGVKYTKGVSKVSFAHGTGLKASSRGAKISVTFVGTGLDLDFQCSPAGGRAKLVVDGVAKNYDTYCGRAHDLVKKLRNLTPGAHKVYVTALGSHSGRSYGNAVRLALVRAY